MAMRRLGALLLICLVVSVTAMAQSQRNPPAPPEGTWFCLTCDPNDFSNDETGDVLDSTAEVWRAGQVPYGTLKIINMNNGAFGLYRWNGQSFGWFDGFWGNCGFLEVCPDLPY